MPRWQLFYHVVWSTRGRDPLIEDRHHDLLQRTLRSSGQRQGALVHAVGIMPNHIHVVASIPPSVSIASFLGQMKGRSSRYLNAEFATNGDGWFGWQDEYSVSSFGEKALRDVIAYVENQRTRHAAREHWPSLEPTKDPPSQL